MLGFGVFVFLAPNIYAAQNALVVTDGAIVYKKADFDAPIIGYFRAGEKVRISEKTFGPFYRVKFKQGKMGYVADIDVSPQKGSSGKSQAKEGDTKEPKSAGKDTKGKNEKANAKGGKAKTAVVNKSLLNQSLLGLSIGMVNWSELFNQREYSDSLIFYGVKASLPFKSVLDGPFTLDVSAIFSFSSGNYLKQASTTPPSGFIAIIDASVLYTFNELMKRQLITYFGAGPVLTYNSFDVEIQGEKLDILEVKIGGAIILGAGYKISRGRSDMVAKIEAHYYFTESNILALLAAFQVGL